jgi:hypothetical protein
MFAVGDRVEVKWQDGNFFAANVTTVHNDGFLGVEYDEVSLPSPIYFFIPTVSLVFRHTNVGTRLVPPPPPPMAPSSFALYPSTFALPVGPFTHHALNSAQMATQRVCSKSRGSTLRWLGSRSSALLKTTR